MTPIEYSEVLDLRAQAKDEGDWTVASVCTLALTQLKRGMRDTPALDYCARLLALPPEERWM